MASYFIRSACDIDIKSLDMEWRILRNYDKISKNTDFLEFWKNVSVIKNGDHTSSFPQLCTFITSILTLPHSSACVRAKNLQRNVFNLHNKMSLLEGLYPHLVSKICVYFQKSFKCIKIENIFFLQKTKISTRILI